MNGWTALLARGAALALVAAALTACASAPAPASRAGNGPGAGPPPPAGAGPQIAPGGPLQCVPFAREASGIQIFGDANTWWAQADGRYPRSHSPAPGSVLVMRGYRDASRGHIAFVSAMAGPRIILVDHANWLNRGEITVAVPVLDVSAENDWSQVRVWHIPSNQWGVRVYEAEGFIHPFLLAAVEGR